MRKSATVNAWITPKSATVNAWITLAIHSFLWITCSRCGLACAIAYPAIVPKLDRVRIAPSSSAHDTGNSLLLQLLGALYSGIPAHDLVRQFDTGIHFNVLFFVLRHFLFPFIKMWVNDGRTSSPPSVGSARAPLYTVVTLRSSSRNAALKSRCLVYSLPN